MGRDASISARNRGPGTTTSSPSSGNPARMRTPIVRPRRIPVAFNTARWVRLEFRATRNPEGRGVASDNRTTASRATGSDQTTVPTTGFSLAASGDLIPRGVPLGELSVSTVAHPQQIRRRSADGKRSSEYTPTLYFGSTLTQISPPCNRAATARFIPLLRSPNGLATSAVGKFPAGGWNGPVRRSRAVGGCGSDGASCGGLWPRSGVSSPA